MNHAILCWCGHPYGGHQPPRPGRFVASNGYGQPEVPEPWHCPGCCAGAADDEAYNDYSAACFHEPYTATQAVNPQPEGLST